MIQGSSVSANWTASDPTPGSGSDIVASGSVTLDTSAIGSHSASAPTAEDNVGHQSATSCSYSVIYNWSSFFQPIDNLDTNGNYILNKAKAGSTVPVKFSLGGDKGLNIFCGWLSAGVGTLSLAARLVRTRKVEEYSTATHQRPQVRPVLPTSISTTWKSDTKLGRHLPSAHREAEPRYYPPGLTSTSSSNKRR